MSLGSVASRENLAAIESLFLQWRNDPQSVDVTWRTFFEGFELGLGMGRPEPGEQTNLTRLIIAYRQVGHYLANLDPLSKPATEFELLQLSEFGFSDKDLDRPFNVSFFRGLQRATLRDLIAALRETYCRTIGVEFMHIEATPIRRWLLDRMEPNRNRPDYDRARKIALLKNLHYAGLFEEFIHSNYKGQKRFSLEGGETLLPMVEALVMRGPAVGVDEIVIGMPHRGRLNVLSNILRKPYEELFAQFEENYLPEESAGDGDVKYHLGFSSDREVVVNGKKLKVHVSLTPNPSHLEAVNPVVEGRVRAKQWFFKDTTRTRGLPVLIHGDAAFAGQGLVTETLQLSQLEGYKTGGTIHIIVNNQIGFTTDPEDGRSTKYCTDVAKMLQVPIFHVNGEDPEACVYVTEMALDFREKFGRDVVIDLICYRKYGHNEGDEPAFTQPTMYSAIRSRPPVQKVYSDRLIQEGVVTPEEVADLDAKFQGKLKQAFDDVKAGPKHYPVMHGFGGLWAGLVPTYSHEPVNTGASPEHVRLIVDRLNQYPEGFQPHPTIVRQFKALQDAVREDKGIHWGPAELLAFGTLLLEGTPVRLSGQDSRRGTFSQRHGVVYDQTNDRPHCALQHLREGQADFQIYDSPLSEAAVVGFEYGYAMDLPITLVLWEAQFGDFANGAQVIIDQYIAAGKSKWDRDNGVVLLLPHGYEGQGPEHSSARLERFLQLCAEDNMQVAYPSTPAQHFHLLRRQMKRNFRKPLVVMTPKSLLRLEACQSTVNELVNGRFHEVLDDPDIEESSRVRRVLLCSGKVYYDLAALRTQLKKQDVAIVRVEQFYPLNVALLQQVLARYRSASEWFWVQEEPQNNGGWYFMEPRLRTEGYHVAYIGRDASASPATGSTQVHKHEQAELVKAAITGSGNENFLVRAPGMTRSRSSATLKRTNGNGAGTTKTTAATVKQ
jgi:2-oxoglutarate dehydrogenase E1 component